MTSLLTSNRVSGLEMNYGQALSHAIDGLVRAYRMRQEELAQALGVSRATAGRKLKGSVTWTAQEVSIVARIFGVSPGDLMPEMRDDGSWQPAAFPENAKAPTEVRASLAALYAIRDSNPGPTD